MSTFKRLSNLAGGKAKEAMDGLSDALGSGLGSKERADRQAEELAMQRALKRELEEDARRRGDGPLDPDDLAARAREVRERIEAAQALRGEAPARVRTPGSSTDTPRSGPPSDDGYEPPGPPELNEDGSVKRTL